MPITQSRLKLVLDAAQAIQMAYLTSRRTIANEAREALQAPDIPISVRQNLETILLVCQTSGIRNDIVAVLAAEQQHYRHTHLRNQRIREKRQGHRFVQRAELAGADAELFQVDQLRAAIRGGNFPPHLGVQWPPDTRHQPPDSSPQTPDTGHRPDSTPQPVISPRVRELGERLSQDLPAAGKDLFEEPEEE